MNYGDLHGPLGEIIRLLKSVDRHTDNNACCVATTSAGTNTSVPAGFRVLTIEQTGAGTVIITMSDGTIYTLSGVGQTYSVSAPIFKSLPAFAISATGGATWQWNGLS